MDGDGRFEGLEAKHAWYRGAARGMRVRHDGNEYRHCASKDIDKWVSDDKLDNLQQAGQ